MSDFENYDHPEMFTIEKGIIKGRELPFIREGKNNFGEILLDKMKNNCKVIGQIDALTENEDTFESMADRSIRCAIWLQNRNIKPGDIVAICSSNHCDVIIPALAALYVGAIFNPWWDYGLTKDMAKHLIHTTQPKVMFVNEACLAIVQAIAQETNPNMEVIIFGKSPDQKSFREIIKEPSISEVENFKCATLSTVDHPAFILYTSGTTGLPKGVLHSHKSLFGNLSMAERLVNHYHVGLCYATLGWITGTLASFASILANMTRIIPGPFIEADACRLIEHYKIDWILMATSMGNRLLKSGVIRKYNVSSVTTINLGGAVLKEESQEALKHAFKNATVSQIYGITEMGGGIVRQYINYKKNSIGNIVENCQLKIIDTDGKTLGPDEQGEICAKSPFVMLEYWKNVEKTREVIDSDGWYHTGDLGYYDKDGTIYIIDRLKELIKWRSHHVSPAMIEQLIQTLPGVVEVAVIGVPDTEDDEHPMAFVVKLPESNVTECDIHQLVNGNLPEQMRLRAGVKFIDKIPHTASSKINRRELRVLAKNYSRD